jgi:hypothetical protein
VSLQNNTLGDFQSAIPSQSFAQICSLHIHWEYITPVQYQYHMSLCFFSLSAMTDIILKMPRLRQLSIFLQGRVPSLSPFQFLLKRLIDNTADAQIPFFTTRVLWPADNWWHWDMDRNHVLHQFDQDRHVRLCRELRWKLVKFFGVWLMMIVAATDVG